MSLHVTDNHARPNVANYSEHSQALSMCGGDFNAKWPPMCAGVKLNMKAPIILAASAVCTSARLARMCVGD